MGSQRKTQMSRVADMATKVAKSWVYQVEEALSEVSALLGMHGKVDLIVPRGSNALVSHIINNTRSEMGGRWGERCAMLH